MTLLELCRLHLRYEPLTGHFYWIKSNNRFMVGKRAGYSSTKGYRQIKLMGVAQMEHVLAWLMMTGELPTQQIDHRNEVKYDNRWTNLRDVSQSINRHNQSKPHRNNKSSGVLGVHRRGSRCIAHIRINNRLITIGRYDSVAEASARYREFKALLAEIR
jgi:HNH endonuclease